VLCSIVGSTELDGMATGALMTTGNAIPLHRIPVHDRSLARRAAVVVGQLLLTVVVIAGGTIAIAIALSVALAAAPLVAVVVYWGIWRSDDVARRRARRRWRARVRRRARALGVRALSR
jgi:hypothetical protein